MVIDLAMIMAIEQYYANGLVETNAYNTVGE